MPEIDQNLNQILQQSCIVNLQRDRFTSLQQKSADFAYQTEH